VTKAGAVGRLGDVTKLLQTQRSQWHMQDFVNGGSLPSLSEKSTRSEVWGYYPRGICWMEKMRRVSRMILASVVNASSRRRAGV